MLKFTITLVVLLGFISCNSLKKQPSTTNPQLVEFDQFIMDIANNYAYLDSRTSEFDCIKKTYRDKVQNISNTAEHILFYETILMEFWDRHIQLNTNVKQSYRVNYLVNSEFKNGKTILKDIWQTQLEPLPKENIIDAEIIRFNDTPFQEQIEAFPTQCCDKQNPATRTWIGNKILAGRYSEPRLLTLKLTNGDTTQLDLDALNVKEETSYLSHKLLENNIGYIRINNSLGETGLVNEFNQALDKLFETKALILDLRNTEGGGNTSVAKPIMGRFISKKQTSQLYQNKKKQYSGFIKPNPKTYTQPLYILANCWTGSMGEGVVIALDGMKRATIIGTEMARLRGGMTNFQFKSKDYAYVLSFEKILHIDGTPREDFIPKIYTRHTQLTEDAQLAKAIEMINHQ